MKSIAPPINHEEPVSNDRRIEMNITDAKFKEELRDLINGDDATELFSIPGVYELVANAKHDEIIEEIERREQEARDAEEYTPPMRWERELNWV